MGKQPYCNHLHIVYSCYHGVKTELISYDPQNLLASQVVPKW